MSLAAPLPSPSLTPAETRVQKEITQAASRIQSADLMTGAAALAALTLGYAAVAVVLDRAFVLPAWLRQVNLMLFGTAFVTLAYYLLLRPLRQRINPRYAARLLETTSDEHKNALINWVDLQERDLPPSLRAAVGKEAAAGLDNVDAEQAVPLNKLYWLAGTAAVFFAVLAMAFVVMKGTQFYSLLSRSFNPFTSTAIAGQTTIELLEPSPADLTITAGDLLQVSVRVSGRLPDPSGPDKVRLKIRYAQHSQEYDEFPLERGDTAREFSLNVPAYVLQNGFWYRVAAGDSETAEHRIDVRTRPLIQGFEATYTYPDYLRMKPEVGREAKLEAFRGTEVSLVVKTNRQVKSGSMFVGGLHRPIEAAVVGDNHDSLRFQLTLTERTTYRIRFFTTSDEFSGDSVSYPIEVIEDRPPSIVIIKPEEEEIVLPINGLLEVNASLSDDFGLSAAALKLRLLADKPLALAEKKYLDGKSWYRASDKSYPIQLDYKDSVALDRLRDTAGQPVALKEGQVLEYWLEATDNCTVPQANVGKSRVQRVRLIAAPQEPDRKAEQERRQQERRDEEQRHQQQQQNKLETERRDPPPPRRQDPAQEPFREQDQPKDPMQPPKDPMQPPMDPKQPDRDPKQPDQDPKQPTPDPKQPGQDTKQPGQDPKQPGQDPKQPPKDPNNDHVERRAQELKNQIEQKEQQCGDARGNPENASRNVPEEKPGGRKTPPPMPPSEPKTGEGANEEPMMPGREPAGQNKPGGQVEKPQQAHEKPCPEPGNDPGSQPQGSKSAPTGGNPGDEKPGPAEDLPRPQTGDAPREQDAGSGRGPDSSSRDPMKPAKAPDHSAQAKKDGQPQRAEERSRPREQDPTAEPQSRPSEARGQKPTEPGQAKSAPKGGSPDRDSQAKPAPKDPLSNDSAVEVKPTPNTKPEAGSARGNEKPAAKPRDLSPEQKAELEKAVRDLASEDPRKQQEAREKLDQMVGKDARQKAEQLGKDLKSEDAGKREAARKELDQLAKQAGQDAGPKPRELTPEQKAELEKAARDLASGDPKKQQEARDKLDQMVGQDAREKAEQLQKDLRSPDAARREAARKELDQLAKQAGQDAGPKPRELTPEQKAELEKAAKDLASGDPKKQQEARDKLDKMVGKDARQKAEQLGKDLKSDDASQREAAQKELEKAAAQGKRDQEIKEALKDLASDDPKKQQQARDKLDQLAGKQAREEAEKIIQESKEKYERLSSKEKQELEKAARDLTSDNDQDRKAAEQKLDDFMGRENRERMQQEQRERQRELDQQLRQQAEQRSKDWQPGPAGGSQNQQGRPLEDNPENRLKASELQLETFKKYRGNKDFLRERNLSEEEYDKFLKDFEKKVDREREEANEWRANGGRDLPKPIIGNDAGGGRITGPAMTTGPGSAGGPTLAPPGFSDSQRRFAEEAAKLKRGMK